MASLSSHPADGWTRVSSHPAFACVWRIVEQEVADDPLLYVELMRLPCTRIEIVYASLEDATAVGAARGLELRAEQIELVEIGGDG